jgi:hypothetical protein
MTPSEHLNFSKNMYNFLSTVVYMNEAMRPLKIIYFASKKKSVPIFLKKSSWAKLPKFVVAEIVNFMPIYVCEK